ncbi:MAG: hypothetical protein JWM89_289 [Acidimicrobiales bacterium]|nr:hypothetical protein [Acidimicrobiales bacterium]
MLKRAFWMSTGMAVGAGGAFWAKRKVEATVERYLPEQVVERVGSSTRDLGRTVKAAATEGRAAMRATEAELRARVEDRTFVGPTKRATAPAGTPPGTTGTPPRGGSRRASRVPPPLGTATTSRRRARR